MYDQLDLLNIAFASPDAGILRTTERLWEASHNRSVAPKTPYSSKKPIEETTRLLLFAANIYRQFYHHNRKLLFQRYGLNPVNCVENYFTFLS